MSAPRVVRRLPSPPPDWTRAVDVVVLGSGAAGMSAARYAAAGGLGVLVLTKHALGQGSTGWAQGGLAAVTAATDSLDSHVRDTLVAGAGLCDPAAVRDLVSAAPAAIAELLALGARFDTDAAGGLALTREGGHSARRVVHAGGDASGAEVLRVLLATGPEDGQIEVLEYAVGLDVLTASTGAAVGVSVLLSTPAGAPLSLGWVHAQAVVLATGGLGEVYAATTNPAGATGDGVAMALRAGAGVADLEFVQFHPTALVAPAGCTGQRLLVSEAVRGEGAVLVDATGARVMAGVHPMGDLAPRDVVAAAIHARMRQAPGGVGDRVWLDATGLGAATLARRFPTVLAASRAAGVDPVCEPIPVSPAAHYSCGGVRADLHGRTGVPGLLAVGEVACTGVHGANRLASNSLTEALVSGRRAGELLAATLRPGAAAPGGPEAEAGGAPGRLGAAAPGGPEAGPGGGPGGSLLDPASRAEITSGMSRWAGVLRDPAGLARLAQRLAHLAQPPAPGAAAAGLDLAAVETTNLHTIATLVVAAAGLRAESRGAHRRADVEGPRPQWARRIEARLRPGGGPLAAVDLTCQEPGGPGVPGDPGRPGEPGEPGEPR